MKLLMENMPEELKRPERGLLACLEAFGRARPVEKIILFGSYARGEQRADSDVDLCIVADGAEDQFAAARDFRRAIREVWPKPALSLIPITPSRLDEKKACGDYFFGTIMKEGRCVAEKD